MSSVVQGPNRARRSAHSHKAIIAAATALAAKQGYGETSVDEIASAASVGKQTIYRWWPNKAALFIEVYGHLVSPDLAADDTGSLAGDLEALLERLSRLYTATPAGDILSGLIAEAQTDPALARQLQETYVIPRRAIIGLIFRRAAERGEAGLPGDPNFLSDLFSGAVWFRLLLGERQLDREFIARLACTLVLVAGQAAPVGNKSPKPRRDAHVAGKSAPGEDLLGTAGAHEVAPASGGASCPG